MAFKDRMGSAEPEISFSSRRAVESIGSVSGRHDDERYDTAAEASRKFGYGKCIYSVRTASGGRTVSIQCRKLFLLSCGITGRETFSSGSRGFWNFRNTLQLSQDIYWSCRKGLLPKPKCIVYTNLACDANLLTFHRLAEFFDIPVFSIDIPSAQTPANVSYVATQLRALVPFLEKVTGRTIDESKLKERLARSRRTLQNYDKFQSARADKYIPSDLVSPLYSGMTNNILLGTEEEELYTQKLLEDVSKAPAKKGRHIYWMHTIPFWSQAVKDALLLKEEAQIVGCELAQVADITKHSEDPYEEMALRLVYHVLNGLFPVESMQESVMRNRQELMVLSGLTTGAASILLGAPGLPRNALKKRAFRC